MVSGGVPTSDLLEKLQEKIEEKDESYSKMVIKLATALIMPKAIGVAEKMFAEFPKLMKVPGNSCFYGQSSEGQIISIEYSDVSAASYKAKVDDPVKTPAGCVEGHGTAFEMLTAVEVNEYSIDYSSDL